MSLNLLQTDPKLIDHSKNEKYALRAFFYKIYQQIDLHFPFIWFLYFILCDFVREKKSIQKINVINRLKNR